MKVINTYIVNEPNLSRLIIIFECENDLWFYQRELYTSRGYRLETKEISREVANDLIMNTNYQTLL